MSKREVDMKAVIKTAIISAFSIATALLWRDVILQTIEFFVPKSEALFYKYLVTIIATCILIIVLYFILKTESKAETMFSKLFTKKKTKARKR